MRGPETYGKLPKTIAQTSLAAGLVAAAALDSGPKGAKGRGPTPPVVRHSADVRATRLVGLGGHIRPALDVKVA